MRYWQLSLECPPLTDGQGSGELPEVSRGLFSSFSHYHRDTSDIKHGELDDGEGRGEGRRRSAKANPPATSG